MKNLVAIICLSVAVLLANASLSWSADFKEGLIAVRNGDYATGLRKLEPIAEHGNFHAQRIVALMYHDGLGVPQDHEIAVKWYTLAAEQMTPSQIVEARNRARECVRKNDKGC